MRLAFSHTHLYPGARAKLDADQAATLHDGIALIEFSDGVVVSGTLDGHVLAVEAYVTASGTSIPQKRWRITCDEDQLRVVARLS